MATIVKRRNVFGRSCWHDLFQQVRWAAGLSGELRRESFARFFGPGQFVIPRSVRARARVVLNHKYLGLFILGDALSENTLRSTLIVRSTNFSSFLALPTPRLVRSSRTLSRKRFRLEVAIKGPRQFFRRTTR